MRSGLIERRPKYRSAGAFAGDVTATNAAAIVGGTIMSQGASTEMATRLWAVALPQTSDRAACPFSSHDPGYLEIIVNHGVNAEPLYEISPLSFGVK
jgi:hypothetical protein